MWRESVLLLFFLFTASGVLGQQDALRVAPMREFRLPAAMRSTVGGSSGDESLTRDEQIRRAMTQLSERAKPWERPQGVLPVTVDVQQLSNALETLLRDAERGWLRELPSREGVQQRARPRPALWVVTDSGVYSFNPRGRVLHLEAVGIFLDSLCVGRDSIYAGARMLILGGVQMPALLQMQEERAAAFADAPQKGEVLDLDLGSQSQTPVNVSETFERGGRLLLAAFSDYSWGARGSRRGMGLRRGEGGRLLPTLDSVQ